MTKLKDARDEHGFNEFGFQMPGLSWWKRVAIAQIIYGWLMNQWLCCVLYYGKRHSFMGVLCHLFYGNYIGTQWDIQR